jgi:hypothetical protein
MKSSKTDVPQYQKKDNTTQRESGCCREQIDSDVKFAFEHQQLLPDCRTADPCSPQDSVHLIQVSLLFPL